MVESVVIIQNTAQRMWNARSFFTHQESWKKDHKYFCEDLGHLCFITVTSCQTLRKMLSTFDICWMKGFFSAQGLSNLKKLNTEDVS